ncbi:transposase-like protein [Fusarium oxysporum f. sp. phaseoli]
MLSWQSWLIFLTARWREPRGDAVASYAWVENRGSSGNSDLGQRIFERQLSSERLRRSRHRNEPSGHILNLVARAFLYGEGFEAFETESQVFNFLGRHEDDL